MATTTRSKKKATKKPSAKKAKATGTTVSTRGKKKATVGRPKKTSVRKKK